MRAFDYMGKTVMITGASMGIGATFARELSRRGAKVVLVARSKDKLEKLAKELGNAEVIVSDLGARGAAQRLLEETQSQGLDIDVLVSNAGFGMFGGFDEIPVATYRDMIDLNVGGLTELTSVFLPMIERNRGGVIHVASTASFQPCPYMAVYGATKSYVLSFSEALWAEYEPRGVRVLALCPGATETPFFERSGENAAVGDKAKPEDVVREGLAAFDAGRATVVQGTRNWLLSSTARFFPRQMVAKIAEKMMRPKTPAALPASSKS